MPRKISSTRWSLTASTTRFNKAAAVTPRKINEAAKRPMRSTGRFLAVVCTPPAIEKRTVCSAAGHFGRSALRHCRQAAGASRQENSYTLRLVPNALCLVRANQSVLWLKNPIDNNETGRCPLLFRMLDCLAPIVGGDGAERQHVARRTAAACFGVR